MVSNLSIDDISIIHLCQTNLMVRPNNSLKISSFNDLLDKKVKIMAMSRGHNSYEFIALKMGNGENLTKLRKNIIVYAKGPKEALSLWRQDPNIDVLIGSSCWKKALENEALFVEVGKEFAMYKAMELAPTKKGLQNQKVQEFINFIKREEEQRILQNTM
ncbi:substrate-binding domain-containing protein [Campylobacter upsaliensis]|nr:substrate-binding domain-containing protein [Campylobacter upsaliensis]MCR2122915.1 substrate-binding domain-containing protein [Campylobacter upsaliensis]